jgi:anaerobic carbon-monoxide dehydrogenase iron sulfur subunit
MSRMLTVTPGRCIGCRTCEVACAFRHAEAGVPGRSRVQVRTLAKDVWVPILCLQCDDAACVQACPVSALWRNAKTGAIDVQNDRCVRCNACVVACPFGNMAAESPKKAVIKCDVCGGEPACAQFCPTRALEYLEV